MGDLGYVRSFGREAALTGGPLIPARYLRPVLTVRQIAAILRARARMAVASGLVAIGVAVAVAFLLPRSYAATATVMVSFENRDPLASEQVPLALLGNFVATQTELIGSSVVMLPTVDRLKLDRDPEFTRGFLGDAELLRDYAAKNLRNSIDVNEGRGGQLIYVTATARSAVQAAKIANTVVDIYFDFVHRQANEPAIERAERYRRQLAELREKVSVAENNIANFRSSHALAGAATGHDEDNPAALQLADLERRLADAQLQRSALEARAGKAPDADDPAMSSHLTEDLDQQIRSGELELATLRGAIVPNNTRIRELEAKVAALRKMLTSERNALASKTLGRLQNAREVENRIRGAVDAQRRNVLDFRTQQEEGAKLRLELESAQAVYKRALDGYDQIAFATSDRPMLVSLISAALPPAKATKPSRVRLLAVGLFAAVGLAFGLPILYELLLRRRVRCRDDVELGMGIPLLVEFPPIADRSSAG